MNKKLEIDHLSEIKAIYREIKGRIISRLEEFSEIWENGTSDELFIELSFCLFTPQSNAKSCWKAVENLIEKGLLFEGSYDEIREEINTVRFRNNKAGYLIEAREKFIGKDKRSIGQILRSFDNIIEKREWLVENVKGMGLKEASHYLRNIGLGQDIAILDRHIIKNMKFLNIIDDIPKSITKKNYYDFEQRLRDFSKKIKIPLSHIDLVLWYREAGDIFK